MDLLIDTSRRPLLRIVVGPEPTLEQFQAVFDTVAKELDRHRSFCVLVNAEHTQRIGFAHAKSLSEFGDRHHKQLEAYIHALAFVLPSPLVAAAVKLAFQLRTPPHPFKICRTVAEADTYLRVFLQNLN